MSLTQSASLLVLLVSIYFLFRLGQAIADGYFNNAKIPWISTVLLMIYGWGILDKGDPIGFIGFIPVITYILIKLSDGIRWESSIKKKVQTVAFSAASSSIVYIVTHHTFKFGVTEASLGAIAAAAILGIAGYRS